MYEHTKHDLETSAQEMSMHIALCISSEYIRSWGVSDFLEKLSDYVDNQGDWYELYYALNQLKERERQAEIDNG